MVEFGHRVAAGIYRMCLEDPVGSPVGSIEDLGAVAQEAGVQGVQLGGGSGLRGIRRKIVGRHRDGVAGQGLTKDEAIWKLKEAISSIEMAIQDESDIDSTPISIKELHEFLTYEDSIADDLAF